MKVIVWYFVSNTCKVVIALSPVFVVFIWSKLTQHLFSYLTCFSAISVWTHIIFFQRLLWHEEIGSLWEFTFFVPFQFVSKTLWSFKSQIDICIFVCICRGWKICMMQIVVWNSTVGNNHRNWHGVLTQDTQLLLWDFAMDEVVVPLRHMAPLGVSPSFSASTNQSTCDGAVHTMGALHPAPIRKEVPKLAPVMAHRVHAEPLSGLLFTRDAIVTACHEGHVKIWDRPGKGDVMLDHQGGLSAVAGSKEVLLQLGKGAISHSRQWYEFFCPFSGPPSILLCAYIPFYWEVHLELALWFSKWSCIS